MRDLRRRDRVREHGVNGVFVKMYGCRTNRQRGPRACPVSVRQDMGDVENALLTHLQEKLLTGEMLTRVLNEYRRAADALLRGRPDDIEQIEAELRDVRAEQKKLAKAVAISDDIPELVSQMKRGAKRIAQLEGQLVASRRAPAELATLMRKMEKDAYERLEKIQATLADPAQLRQVFLSAFPEGFQMSPRHDGARAGWEINGLAESPLLSERDSCLLSRDPNVPGCRLQDDSTFEFAVLNGRPVEEPVDPRGSSTPDAWRGRRSRPRRAISA